MLLFWKWPSFWSAFSWGGRQACILISLQVNYTASPEIKMQLYFLCSKKKEKTQIFQFQRQYGYLKTVEMGKSVKQWYKKSLKETKLVEPTPYKLYAGKNNCSMENWKLRCFLKNKRKLFITLLAAQSCIAALADGNLMFYLAKTQLLMYHSFCKIPLFGVIMKRIDIVCFIQMINLLLFHFYCLSSVALRGRGRINYELKDVI